MSEVVKKLVTELGYKIVDQDKIKKYSNTAKDILKTQKESNKVNEKGLTLKQKEKQQLKENAKLETEKIKQQTRLELARLKQVEKSDKERNRLILQREKEVNKNKLAQQKRLDSFKKQQEKIEVQKTKQEQQRLKQQEKLKLIQTKREQDEIKRNAIQLEQRKAMTKQLLAGALIERQMEQQRKQSIYKQRQEERNLRGQERRDIIASNRAGAYDRRLNFGAGQRGQTFDTRMNDILARKGKMIDPNNPNKIINIPKQQPKQWIDREATGQYITDKSQQLGQVTKDVVLSSIDKMLNYEYLMNELKVRGELSNKEAANIDKVVKSMSLKWGTDIMSTAETAIALAKSGIVGKPLAFMTEEITMLSRSMGTTPQMAGEMLNAFLHQQGKNLQTKDAISKGIGVTQDPQAVKKASNLLSAAINASALDPKDLMYTLKYASTSAAQAGVSPEDFLFESMRLANRFQKGSTSGTGQRRIFQTFTTQLEDMLVSEEAGKGKKKGKKGSKTDYSYAFKDFGIFKKDYYKDFGGTMRLDYINLMLDLQRSMKKKGFDQLKRLAVTGDLTGLTASQVGLILGEDLTPEDRKMQKSINQANKKDETRRTATALSQTGKTTWDRVRTAKDIALTGLGEQFKPETEFVGQGLLRMLTGFSQNKGMKTAGKGLGIGLGVGAGVGALATPVALMAGVGMLPVAGAVAAATGAYLAFHDAVALLKGDQTIIGGLISSMKAFFNVSDPINNAANSIRNLSNTLANATRDIQQFLGSYQTMAKLGIVEVGVNVTNGGYRPPYAPNAPTNKPTNYVLSSSANKSVASRKG